MSGKDIVDFTIKGKVGVAVLVVVFTSVFGVAGLGVKVSTQSDLLDKQETRIKQLETSCNTISVALARIEENTASVKEKIQDLKHSLETRNK